MRESAPQKTNFFSKHRLVGLALASSAMLSGCGLGSAGNEVSQEDKKPDAVRDYNHGFRKASAAGKYALQYLDTPKVAFKQYPDARGIKNLRDQNNYRTLTYTFNNACLKSTAYDTIGGTIEGYFYRRGYIEGNVPSAAAFAEINPENDDQLIVRSGHANSVNLTFGGLRESNELLPANEQTKNILKTYGCEIGIRSIEETWRDETSAYLR